MNDSFVFAFFIGALIMTRVVSLIIEVPTLLITIFVSRKYLLLAPILSAVLTFVFVLAMYVFFPVRNKSLSSGDPILEISLYASSILIWLLVDVLIVIAIKSIMKPQLQTANPGSNLNNSN